MKMLYLKKMRGIPEQNRMRTRNEYYWFSTTAFEELGLLGKVKLAVMWAQIAESA